MSAPDPRVAPLLAAGQVVQVGVRATVLLRGGGGVAVPVSAGGRRSSAAYIHRHELALTVPDLSLVQAKDAKQRAQWDALDFGDGHRIRPYLVFKVGSETVLCYQGEYRITEAPRDGAGSWVLGGKSLEYLVQRADLLADVTVRGSARAALASLIQAAVPGVELVLDDDVTDVILPAMLCESGQPGSRWAAVVKVAESCGWVVACDLNGAFRVSRAKSVAGPVDWEARYGESLVSFASSASDEGVCNVAVVTSPVTQSDDGRRMAPRYVGVAADDRPGSPTYVGDDVVRALASAATRGLNAVPQTYGLYAQRVEMDGIGSDVQAGEAARGMLAGRASRVESVAAWQPWADVEDRVLIVPDGAARLAVLTAVDVDFAAGSGMKLEVRE